MQLFMAVPMTTSAVEADFGGRGRLWRPDISPIYLLQLFPILSSSHHLHGVLVLVTGKKFIAGVVVTGDNG
jgi:hypothetical protein